MQIHVSVIDSNGITISRNNLAASNTQDMLMQILAVHSGTNNIAKVSDLYKSHDLYSKSADEAVATLVNLNDEDDPSIDCLNLQGVADNVEQYLKKLVQFISTSQVGGDMEEVGEFQTTLFVKIS